MPIQSTAQSTTGSPGSEENDAAAAQAEFIDAFDGIVGHRISQRRSGVDVEGGDVQRLLGME